MIPTDTRASAITQDQTNCLKKQLKFTLEKKEHYCEILLYVEYLSIILRILNGKS